MTRIDSINREQIQKINKLVLEYHGYIDEFVESDVLFIIEYALGLKNNYNPDDWMLDIIEDVFK